jgi:hypothetical protein
MTVTKEHYAERLMGRNAFTAAFCCFNPAPGHQPANQAITRGRGGETAVWLTGVTSLSPVTGISLA